MMKTYKERFNEKIKKKYLNKVEVLKDLFKTILPGIDDDKLVLLVGRCSHYHSNQRKQLDKDSSLLYDFMLKNNFNPCTLYKWFLVSMIPENLQDLLNKGKLTQMQALKIAVNTRRQQELNLGWELMEESRKIIKEVFQNAETS